MCPSAQKHLPPEKLVHHAVMHAATKQRVWVEYDSRHAAPPLRVVKGQRLELGALRRLYHEELLLGDPHHV